MKTLLPFLLLGSLAVSAKAAGPDEQLPPAPHGKSFKLVWHDEFDGDRLDEAKWTYRPDGKHKGGWWSRKAISLDGDGHLVITTFMDGDKPTKLNTPIPAPLYTDEQVFEFVRPCNEHMAPDCKFNGYDLDWKEDFYVEEYLAPALGMVRGRNPVLRRQHSLQDDYSRVL